MAKVIYEFTNATGSDLPDKLGRGEYAYDTKFIADDGYSFESQIYIQNSTPYIKIDYEWGAGRKTTSGTQVSYVNDDFTEIHVHLWFTTTTKLQWEDLTIFIEALPEAPSTPSIPLKLDLTNMTASLENGVLLEDGDVEITFTADEGYTLENVSMEYNRPNGSMGFHYLTGLEDTKTFQINTTYMNDLEIIAVAEEFIEPVITTEIVEVFEVIPFDTEEVDNPDLFIGETEVSEGVEGELKITYLVTYHDGVEFERVEQNRERVTEPINKIVSRGTKPLPPKTIPLNLDIRNMTASLENGALLEDGEVEISFIANEGYTLEGVSISFNRPNGTTSDERVTDSDNKLTFTVNTTYMNDLTISGSANPVTKQISTFNNVYHVTSEDLTELSGVRFASTSTGDVIDYGAYITKLYLLPFEIPDDLLAGTGAIQLGMFNSNVETTVLNDYQFKVDLGKIEVPEKYNNVYDYLQTRCFVYLPFTNRIEIESSYIIDCTIQIEYVVNLYNGESTINIYSSKTEEPIHSETVKVVDDIPFMQTTTGNTLSETNTVYNNGILNPFIIVERNIPYDEVDSVFGGEVVENGILNQFNGYVEVNDFKMKSKATSQEQSEIQTLLRNGVFINGEN